MTPTVLATDLDGTLIPLDGNTRNTSDLRELDQQLRQAAMQLVFVTGRHLSSVVDVMRAARLPIPDWIIADVGTSIYQRVTIVDDQPTIASTSSYALSAGYAAELQALIGTFTVERLSALLSPITSLRLQEAEKQSRFKLSYYVDRAELREVKQHIAQLLHEAQAPYSTVVSVDPFTDDGLVDLLPRNVTKAYGIEWWGREQSIARSQILYAGDSGNDSAVFAAGFRSIVVGNADNAVLQAATQSHAEAGWIDRLYSAELPATSGVLAGVRHFLLT